MPTALIAEDEPLLREQLKRRLHEAWPELSVVAEAGNGAEALAGFENTPVDVAFLDIRMPVMTGLEVARALGGRAHVVFVTAYDDYAVAAFEEAVAAQVERFRALSAPVLRLTKRAVVESLGRDFEPALAEVEDLYRYQLMSTEDAAEGLRAFMEKRKPVWKDR